MLQSDRAERVLNTQRCTFLENVAHKFNPSTSSGAQLRRKGPTLAVEDKEAVEPCLLYFIGDTGNCWGG